MKSNRLGSHKDEIDRELFFIVSVLKDLVLTKYQYDPSWQGRIKDLDTIMQHIVNRRYGQPIDKQ